MSHPSPNFLTCPIEPPPEPPVSVVQEKKEPVYRKEQELRQQPRAKASVTRWVTFGIILIVVAVSVPAVYRLVQAGRAAYDARTAISEAQARMKEMDFEAAKTQLEHARTSLSIVHDTLHAMSFWRNMPGLGTQIRGLEDAAAVGSGTLDGIGDMLTAAVAITDALRGSSAVDQDALVGIAPTRTFSQLTAAEKKDILQRLSNQLPQLRLARDKIDVALELWKRVPQDQLAAPIRSALEPLAQALPVLQRSLDEALPMIEALVPMAGYPQPRKYLMALQNADELRPAGGFIGTIGGMTWNAGEMSEFGFSDIYTVDNPVSGVWKETPPEPIQKYLGLSQWFLRDANWSPDFPTSAERILDFYIREVELQAHAKLPQPPTTYIAFEPGFFSALLRLTGPITVDGEVYDAQTFFERLEYNVEVAWHERGLPVEKRKEIISKIGDELMKKVFTLPASRWPEVLDIVTKALERKQIMAYSRDRDLQRVFDVRGWSGRAKETDGDFLWVVDANLAALKTDGAMDKQVRYHVDMTDPLGPKATVTLTYANTAKGFSDYRYTRYRSYTRVYVPEGSELISSTGAMKDDLHSTGGVFVSGKVDVMKELGKTVYGAFWSVEPGRTQSMSFTYRLPKTVTQKMTEGKYHLTWLKQPGADDTRLTLIASFGKNLKTAVPAEDHRLWGDHEYEIQTDSLMDREFTVTF